MLSFNCSIESQDITPLLLIFFIWSINCTPPNYSHVWVKALNQKPSRYECTVTTISLKEILSLKFFFITHESNLNLYLDKISPSNTLQIGPDTTCNRWPIDKVISLVYLFKKYWLTKLKIISIILTNIFDLILIVLDAKLNK